MYLCIGLFRTLKSSLKACNSSVANPLDHSNEFNFTLVYGLQAMAIAVTDATGAINVLK